MQHWTTESLKRVFPQFSLPLLEEIAQSAFFMEIAAGDVLAQTDAYVKNGMIIIEGSVKVYREGEDGSSFFVYFLQPGNVCSMSISCGLYNRQFNVKAVAEDDATVVSIPPQKLRAWMNDYPEWVEFIIGSYRQRFEDLLDALDQVSFLKLDERLWNYLQSMRTKNSGADVLKISHQEIANDLNSTREVISRLLKVMENEGFLETGRGKINFLAKFDQPYGL
ncbi:MAG: Crp/Fnr family transcriptional regulator [Cryomorphaceae bacterium]|nr:Crp/Fnr family transcriptional regulator [Cryomorphaceae bacterium]